MVAGMWTAIVFATSLARFVDGRGPPSLEAVFSSQNKCRAAVAEIVRQYEQEQRMDMIVPIPYGYCISPSGRVEVYSGEGRRGPPNPRGPINFGGYGWVWLEDGCKISKYAVPGACRE